MVFGPPGYMQLFKKINNTSSWKTSKMCQLFLENRRDLKGDPPMQTHTPKNKALWRIIRDEVPLGSHDLNSSLQHPLNHSTTEIIPLLDLSNDTLEVNRKRPFFFGESETIGWIWNAWRLTPNCCMFLVSYVCIDNIYIYIYRVCFVDVLSWCFFRHFGVGSSVISLFTILTPWVFFHWNVHGGLPKLVLFPRKIACIYLTPGFWWGFSIQPDQRFA